MPVHEFMQSAQPRHPLRRRSQHQVIGIAKDDISTNAANISRLHRLDRRGGANGHERRRGDVTALH